MEGVEIGNLQIPAIKGEKGDTGAAGKISSLTITMLESTATPTVTNTGTVYDANYVLGIPRGTGISTVVINEDGELEITLTDNTELNLGQVVGTSITNVEINEDFDLIVTLSDSTKITAGNLDDELSDIIDTHLANYYTKSEVYNKTELANVLTNAAAAGKQIAFQRKDGSTFYADLTSTFDSYQLKLSSSRKLSADYVNDTATTNKFVTTAEKTAIGTIKTDYAHTLTLSFNTTNKQLSVGIANYNGSVLDEGAVDLGDYFIANSDIATTITSSSTNSKVAGAKAVYDYVTGIVGDINSVLDEINGEVV